MPPVLFSISYEVAPRSDSEEESGSEYEEEVSECLCFDI